MVSVFSGFGFIWFLSNQTSSWGFILKGLYKSLSELIMVVYSSFFFWFCQQPNRKSGSSSKLGNGNVFNFLIDLPLGSQKPNRKFGFFLESTHVN